MKKIECSIVMKNENRDLLENEIQDLIKACHKLNSIKEMNIILFDDKGKPKERIHAIRVIEDAGFKV